MAKSKHKKKTKQKSKHKSKQKPKQQHKKNGKPLDANDRSLLKLGMIDSKFLARLRAEFLAPELVLNLWLAPFPKPDSIPDIADDLASALRSIFLVLENSDDPLPGLPNSATQLLGQVITATGWPTSEDFPPTSPWTGDHEDAFRLYEIACAVNILMQTYNRHFPGGGPETWPPERPK